MRLDAYCAEFWPEQSRSTWQKLIKAGHVRVNGETIDSPKFELDEDDHVEVEQPKQLNFTDQTLPIIYQDDNVIVINKPVGVLTHAKGALTDEFSVAEFFRPLTTFGSETNRPGIVHRLDRDTSGILIGARNPEAASLLARQFQDRKAKKTYIAVLDGSPKQPEAIIDLPIGRNPKKPSQFKVDPNGKSATTDYSVIRSDGIHTLVKLMPHTGRTHQLRVHMAYLGTPISGDKVYGKESDRLYLHARSLEITIPGSKRMTFEAPLPPEFEKKVK